MEGNNSEHIGGVVGVRLDQLVEAVGPERLEEPLDVRAGQAAERAEAEADVLDHHRALDQVDGREHFGSGHLLGRRRLVLGQADRAGHQQIGKESSIRKGYCIDNEQRKKFRDSV